MTRDTTDRRTHRGRTPRRTADHVRRIPTPDPDPEVPLAPETTGQNDGDGGYRADPFELALMEGSE